MHNSERRHSSRRLPEDRDFSPIDETVEEDYQEEHAAPRRGWTYALIVGLVGGIITVIVPVGIVILNASLFNEAGSAASKGGTGLSALLGPLLIWQCVGVIAEIILVFFIGRHIGKMTGKRWPGLVGGAVAGAVINLLILAAQYIPSYPGMLRTINSNHMGYDPILAIVVPLAVYAVVGAIISFFGALTTANKYSHSQQQG